MGLLGKIEKALNMDGETRNKKLLEELGIDTTLYNHAAYKEFLIDKELEPLSILEMAKNFELTEDETYTNLTDAFIDNRMTISVDSRNGVVIEQSSMDNIKTAAQKVDAEMIKPYIEALSLASGKDISHDFVLKMQADARSGATGHSYEPYADVGGDLNVEYKNKKVGFTLAKLWNK